MPCGRYLTEWQQQTLIAQWLLTRNGEAAAKAAGVPPRTARRWLNERKPELAALAAESSPSLVQRLDELIDQWTASLFDPRQMDTTMADRKAVIVGILIDKRELLAGRPTSRSELGRFDPNTLSPQEKELAAKLRAKMAKDGDPVGVNGHRR